MIAAWLVTLALASPQEVAELEWARMPPVMLAPHATDPDAETRRSAARALGRLRVQAALPFLDALGDDPDALVRLQAAEAMALTPGSGPRLRAWLDRVPVSLGIAGHAGDATGLRVTLVEGLGHNGGPDDIDQLSALIAEPWPYSAAAARALGRLGRRDVHGVHRAVDPLVRALARPDPRTREAAAYALRRIGLGDAPNHVVANAAAALDRGNSEAARAWLVRAMWPALGPDARVDLFIHSVTDASRLVQVSALQAADEGLPSDIIAPFIQGQDPWVSVAALEALGRVGDDVAIAALERAADTDDAWRSATALAAMRVPDRARAMDPAQPAQVRAALVAALPTAELLTLALEDAEPAVRTAAAATLLERGESSARSGAALVGADDPLVREVGVDLLLRGGDPDASAAGLLRVLADESDEGVLRATFAGLDQLAASAPKAVDQGRRAITTALTTLPPDISARLRSAARGLSRRLKLEWDEPPPSGPSTTTLQLDGREVEIEVGAPTLDDVGSIQLARVQTTRGAFTIALDPTTAPYAVANFARLSEVGWYDDLVFHRVVPGFVVQTGCPRGDGWGGPGWTVPDEVSLGGFGTGSVGMARAEPDSGGSQWFVTLSPQPHLDGDYTRFGQVVQGLHVVRGLERGDRVLAVTIERAR